MRAATAVALTATSILTVVGCGGGDDDRADPPTSGATVMTVTSTSFDEGQPIPQQYTCDGAAISPPIAWSGPPADTSALALVVDDPDAPGGTYVHWLVANIDPAASEVAEDAVPSGGVEVANSSGDASYAGPCPPSGTHHYRFTVYALSSPLDVGADTDVSAVFAAIEDASIGRGTLTATYAR